MQKICISFLRWKTEFLGPKLISLPIRNMFNQILSNLAIYFLVAHFILQLIQFFLISIFNVKNSVFSHKTYIYSHSEHVQPNFIKFGNNVLVGTLTYSNFAILLLGLENKHFERKNSTFTLHTQLNKNYIGNTEGQYNYIHFNI